MNDTYTLARIIANEIDAEMHRKSYEQGMNDGAKREREACAKVCDELTLFGNPDERYSAKQCAKAIRNRESK